jgi:hypothetical protein
MNDHHRAWLARQYLSQAIPVACALVLALQLLETAAAVTLGRPRPRP